MRSLLAASDDCIKVLNLDGALTFMSEGGQRVMEISDFNAVKGCPWPDFWRGEGTEQARAAIEAARAGKSSRFVGSANTFLGNPRWWDVQVSPILGPDGRPESILSVSRDVTELKVAEERQTLIALELKHRIKNTLAIVQAIANQTLKPGGTVAEARVLLLDRLRTLGSAQDMLTQSAGSKAQLDALCEGVLKPYDMSERIEIGGPQVELSSKCALAMSLALYELATNAIKYGALSNDAGRVAISWEVDDAVHPAGFSFRWQEAGGPEVALPSRTGFGTRMIERALAGYFGGEAKLAYPPGGVVFTLRSSLDRLIAD